LSYATKPGESKLRLARANLNLSTNRRGGMDLSESYTHSFVVKIWLEDEAQVRWRGHITHVPGGERRYVDDLSEIQDFIAPYLEEMGVEPGTFTRLKRRLSNWVGLNRQL